MKKLQLPESSVYRKIHGEIILVQLETSRYFHFNEASEEFFTYFKEPKGMDDFFDSYNVTPETEREHLKNFAKYLITQSILKETDGTPAKSNSSNPKNSESAYQRPNLLKEGTQKLEEISFACP